MNNLIEDCLSLIVEYLVYPEVCSLSEACAFRIKVPHIKYKKWRSAPIVRRYVLAMSAHICILRKFIRKCREDSSFRSRYLFIHQTESPHLCLRRVPIWMKYNRYRNHIHLLMDDELNGWVSSYLTIVSQLNTQ